MTPIASRSNPTVARFRAARDGKDGRSIFVEGRRLLEELLDSTLTPREAAVIPQSEKDPKTAPLIQALRDRGATVHAVTSSVMEFISDVETPPGIAVRADRPHGFDLATVAGLGTPPPLILLLDALQSPANVGAILRSAEAAGVTAVGVLPGTADPLSPKALRASAGSAFRIPIFRTDSIQTILNAFPTSPALLAADAGGSHSYFQWNWTAPCVLLLGGEARGVNFPSLGALPVQRIKIPMAGRVESLNVAVAAGILLMEARRQRTVLHTGSAFA
ncbi:MAG: RNA methyltransferase [Elusimicrobia bacterium]|nr:RNA methyltransferase [Elusimicrobiota bacterium]